MKLKKRDFNIVLTLVSTLVIIDLISKNKYSHNVQFYLVIFASISYLVWALIYHKLDKSLTLSNYLEYVLTATLAIILLLGIFNI